MLMVGKFGGHNDVVLATAGHTRSLMMIIISILGK